MKSIVMLKLLSTKLHALSRALNNWIRLQLGLYRWRTIICVAAMIGTMVPHLVGWLAAPAGARYLARGPIAAADTMVYYGAMEEATRGKFFVSNPFTSEPQQARLIQPVWLVSGWILWATRLPVEIVFQLVRLIVMAGFLFFLWRLTRLVAQSLSQRTWTFFILCFSSGFGWLEYVVARHGTSYDLWVSESNTFLSMLHSPLFMISQMLLLGLMLLWWKVLQVGKSLWWWGAGAALLALIHPYDFVTLVVTCGVMSGIALVQNKSRATVIQMVCATSLWMIPIAGYYYWVLQEPALRGWAEQNLDLTGPIQNVVLGLGIFLPAVIFSIRPAFRQKWMWAIPLGAWLISVAVLISLPHITFQRRLFNGIHIPLVLLSMAWWWHITHRWTRERSFYITLALSTIAALSTVVIIVHHSLGFLSPARAQYPAYLSRDEQAAIQATQRLVSEKTPIWTAPWVGNSLAGLTNRPVVLGHGHQTVNFNKKMADWRTLRFIGATAVERAEIISRTSPWMLWEQADRIGEYNPLEDSHWEHVWQQGEVSLLRWKN